MLLTQIIWMTYCWHLNLFKVTNLINTTAAFASNIVIRNRDGIIKIISIKYRG